MCLIFDEFPTREAAEQFAEVVEERLATEEVYPTFFEKTKRKTMLCDSRAESDTIEWYPCELVPPIVLVERPKRGDSRQEFAIEHAIEDSVEEFGGRFAGSGR
jgi:hypothetical protein